MIVVPGMFKHWQRQWSIKEQQLFPFRGSDLGGETRVIIQSPVEQIWSRSLNSGNEPLPRTTLGHLFIIYCRYVDSSLESP